jgi:tetratricopeptide (TPR) repeat protein
VGSLVPAYAWARQDAWEQQAPAYLLALWRDAVLSLGRAYRDSGEYAAAVKVYATLLDQDPQLDNAQQGLLLAAAGTGDPAGLETAWERVRTAWDGDPPDDLHDLYDKLRREVAARGTSR